MKTILYMPTIDWHFLKQRPQQLLSQFAKNGGYRVIYCNQTQSQSPPEEVEPNLFVHHNFAKVLEDIRFKKIKVDITYVTWAKSYIYLDFVPSKMVIYDSLDSFDEWKIYEPTMMSKANIVLTTSQFLYDLRSKEHNNVHLVRNACDSSFIGTDFAVPSELKDIHEPKIGFVGAIGKWVNTNLMKKVADKYPHTYFVGKEFGKTCPSNVINLGTKDHKDLINYYNSFDVCLLPFLTKQEVTTAANPIKQYEHMSCGKPTVATKWHETEIYPDAILASETEDEFLANIDKAIKLSKDQKFKQKCVEIAKENTWEERFKQIQIAIDDYCKKRGVRL